MSILFTLTVIGAAWGILTLWVKIIGHIAKDT